MQTSRNMLPRFSMNDALNRRVVHVISSTDRVDALPATMSGPDCNDVGGSEFCAIVALSNTDNSSTLLRPMAILSHHVIDVRLTIPEEKMVGTNAKPIVTVVKHPDFVADGAISKDVREAMGVQASSTQVNGAIAILGGLATPKPATIGLLHFRPKTRNDISVATRLRTVASRLLRGVLRSGLPACGTGILRVHCQVLPDSAIPSAMPVARGISVAHFTTFAA